MNAFSMHQPNVECDNSQYREQYHTGKDEREVFATGLNIIWICHVDNREHHKLKRVLKKGSDDEVHIEQLFQIADYFERPTVLTIIRAYLLKIRVPSLSSTKTSSKHAM